MYKGSDGTISLSNTFKLITYYKHTFLMFYPNRELSFALCGHLCFRHYEECCICVGEEHPCDICENR